MRITACLLAFSLSVGSAQIASAAFEANDLRSTWKQRFLGF